MPSVTYGGAEMPSEIAATYTGNPMLKLHMQEISSTKLRTPELILKVIVFFLRPSVRQMSIGRKAAWNTFYLRPSVRQS